MSTAEAMACTRAQQIAVAEKFDTLRQTWNPAGEFQTVGDYIALRQTASGIGARIYATNDADRPLLHASPKQKRRPYQNQASQHHGQNVRLSKICRETTPINAHWRFASMRCVSASIDPLGDPWALPRPAISYQLPC